MPGSLAPLNTQSGLLSVGVILRILLTYSAPLLSAAGAAGWNQLTRQEEHWQNRLPHVRPD